MTRSKMERVILFMDFIVLYDYSLLQSILDIRW